MNRRAFLGIAAASIFAPRFGRWYRQGSGLIVPLDSGLLVQQDEWMRYRGHMLTLTVSTHGPARVEFVVTDRLGRTQRVPGRDTGGGLYEASFPRGQWATVQAVGTVVDSRGLTLGVGESPFQLIP